MSQNKPATTLDRLLDSIASQLPPEAARAIAELHAPDDVRARLDELAEKTTQGELEPEERAEYESVLQIAHVITLIQARLASQPAAGPRPDARPDAVPAPAPAPRVVTPGRNQARLSGLEAMLDDLDVEPGQGS